MGKLQTIISFGLGALAVIVVSVYFIWFAPADFQGEKYLFVIERGQTLSDVIDDLSTKSFIRSQLGAKVAFKLNRAGVIQAGTYNVSPRMNAWQIANIISSAQTAVVKVTIPEGYTVKQVAELLDTKGVITASDFLNVAQNYISDRDFLVARTNHSLEGYLFPDTYNMNKGTPAQDLAEQMMSNFSQRIRSLVDAVAQNKYNLHQIVTLASLVEKEARTDEDRKLMAGVMLNRLNIGMKLDIDATVRFLTNDWKNPISQADLNINSPYNTRKVAGLPPGPICNPGLAAIKAVLFPTSSNYFYYLTASDGTSYYARTLDEHNTNKAKYL